ncbi:hypothetical protein Pyn_14640 [Prunus yedoensis var. nudiflora]|uniref:Uncharacterized protein n=1 Tax=Prunus yedoensis var. nudiflora TaxID=2094558 RepID=A0A314Z7C6_PRUYE|nr:hypothetical protein Pyn_14640 [Prunus yedoensis var. nudiflora]
MNETNILTREKRMLSGWFGLCYDRCEGSLFEWSKDSKLNSDPKFNLCEGAMCQGGFWIDFISEMLGAISCIHDQKLYHQKLSLMSYFFVDGKLKLTTVENTLEGLGKNKLD